MCTGNKTHSQTVKSLKACPSEDIALVDEILREIAVLVRNPAKKTAGKTYELNESKRGRIL